MINSMDILFPLVSPEATCSFLFFLFAAHELLQSTNPMHIAFPRVAAAASFSNKTDRLALLHFKDETNGDILSSWNDSCHFCEWEGVTCGRRHPERVTALDLSSYNLVAHRISPHISNLTFLSSIDLANNTFHGVIPAEMGRLFRLRVLNLANNTLSGEIPVNLTSCSKLMILDLHGNKLSGSIPSQLGSLPKLHFLALGPNNLTGRIPPCIGNLSSLAYLFLSTNRLEGSIPTELSQLRCLLHFDVSDNQLSGTVPSSIYNLSALQAIDLGTNRLQGDLPPHLFLTLPNLAWFTVGPNKFTGPIPISLPNATNLQLIDFCDNRLQGSLPGNLGSLQKLEVLEFAINELGSGSGQDLSFLDSLINCSNLEILAVGDNSLNGALSNSLANLSTQLQLLGMEGNMIFGSIPSGIGNLINLTRLDLERNMLTGAIPLGIGKLQKMVELHLDGNKLSTEILNSFCNLTQLSTVNLSENNLEGSIPSCLENCKQLQFVFFQNNNLVGTLPKQLSNLRILTYLEVQNNSLAGNLPMEVGRLQGLEHLDISNNHLIGEIPASLGSCVSLEFLLLSGNHFQGFLPSTLNSIHGLRILDVSCNNLSGKIPDFLEKFALDFLNLSFNNFEGELPRQGIFENDSAISVIGNPKLCGGIQELQLPACFQERHKKIRISHVTKIKIITAGIVPGTIAVSCSLAIFIWLGKLRKKPSLHCYSLEDSFMDVSYAELLKATDGFSFSNLIGSGNYGCVYKGTLHQNILGTTMVAIKVLNLLKEGAFKSFIAECQALRNIRHRNLIRILTCCSSIDFKGNDFKALVFEYMPNGSLQNWLSKDEKGNMISGRNLKLIERLNIAIDVASALDYLHHHCQSPIIHRDLKPSNVLLDANMVAHIGDFGLARFASATTQSSTIGMKGSIGYIAPEYAMREKASAKGDIYSYGILLLEMVTGKGPTDGMFVNDLTLHHHVRLALLADRVVEIVDPSILLEEANQTLQLSDDSEKKMYECLISLARIGVACSTKYPGERMKISKVIVEMHAIREFYLGVRGRGKHIMTAILDDGTSYLSKY